MKTKLACFALGTLVLTVAVYLLWNVDDPIVADVSDSAPAVAPPNVDNELNNQATEIRRYPFKALATARRDISFFAQSRWNLATRKSRYL